MAVYSMTGFARVQVALDAGGGYTLSLKSVNHRFLDLGLRLPSALDPVEAEIRKAIKERVARGHIDVTVQMERGAAKQSGYNRELVATYLASFDAARKENGLGGEPDLNRIFAMPGAFQAEARSDDDSVALGASVLAQLGPLLNELQKMRAREGDALAAILNGTMDRLAEATAGVAALRPEVEKRFQERIVERLQAAVGDEFDRGRVLQEAAVLVERSEVSEELDRMGAHIAHFRQMVAEGGEVGKKLDFLLQEMNREANTLLSKTGGVAGKGSRITELGLAMKSEIEKAREQVQNIE